MFGVGLAGQTNANNEEARIIRENNLPKNIRLRATLFFNLRSSSSGIYVKISKLNFLRKLYYFFLCI